LDVGVVNTVTGRFMRRPRRPPGAFCLFGALRYFLTQVACWRASTGSSSGSSYRV